MLDQTLFIVVNSSDFESFQNCIENFYYTSKLFFMHQKPLEVTLFYLLSSISLSKLALAFKLSKDSFANSNPCL